MLSLKGNPGVESSQDKSNLKTKSIITKTSKDNKDIYSMDLEYLQRIFKKLSIKIIYLKKNPREGSFNPKKIFKLQPKKDNITPPTNKTNPPTLDGINMEDIVQTLQDWESKFESK